MDAHTQALSPAFQHYFQITDNVLLRFCSLEASPNATEDTGQSVFSERKGGNEGKPPNIKTMASGKMKEEGSYVDL